MLHLVSGKSGMTFCMSIAQYNCELALFTEYHSNDKSFLCMHRRKTCQRHFQTAIAIIQDRNKITKNLERCHL